jgi:hypothetical protein
MKSKRRWSNIELAELQEQLQQQQPHEDEYTLDASSESAFFIACSKKATTLGIPWQDCGFVSTGL